MKPPSSARYAARNNCEANHESVRFTSRGARLTNSRSSRIRPVKSSASDRCPFHRTTETSNQSS